MIRRRLRWVSLVLVAASVAGAVVLWIRGEFPSSGFVWLGLVLARVMRFT